MVRNLPVSQDTVHHELLAREVKKLRLLPENQKSVSSQSWRCCCSKAMTLEEAIFFRIKEVIISQLTPTISIRGMSEVMNIIADWLVLHNNIDIQTFPEPFSLLTLS